MDPELQRAIGQEAASYLSAEEIRLFLGEVSGWEVIPVQGAIFYQLAQQGELVQLEAAGVAKTGVFDVTSNRLEMRGVYVPLSAISCTTISLTKDRLELIISHTGGGFPTGIVQPGVPYMMSTPTFPSLRYVAVAAPARARLAAFAAALRVALMGRR